MGSPCACISFCSHSAPVSCCSEIFFSLARTCSSSEGSLRSTTRLVFAISFTGLRAASPSFSTFLLYEAMLRTPHSARSEEHTSELQSQFHLVCRLLLEKKKKRK